MVHNHGDRKSPICGVVPPPNGHSWLINGGGSNYSPTRTALQAFVGVLLGISFPWLSTPWKIVTHGYFLGGGTKTSHHGKRKIIFKCLGRGYVHSQRCNDVILPGKLTWQWWFSNVMFVFRGVIWYVFFSKQHYCSLALLMSTCF